MTTLTNPTVREVVESALEYHQDIKGGSPTRPDKPSITAIRRRAGLGKNTIYEWGNRNNARYEEFRAFIMACGGTIKVEFPTS